MITTGKSDYQAMEPIVLIDGRRNKETHIVIPVNNQFEDLLAAARRLNADMFEGEWDLCYLNDKKEAVAVDLEEEISTYVEQGIDTFYWRYRKPRLSRAAERAKRSRERQKEFRQQRQKPRRKPQMRTSGDARQVFSMEYAAFSRRVFAWIIDLFVVAVISGFLFRFFHMASPFLVLTLYYAFMESSASQATLGKMMLGLRVTDSRGKTLTFSKAFMRNVLRYFTTPFIIGGFFIFSNRKGQALHDLIADSVVIEEVDY